MAFPEVSTSRLKLRRVRESDLDAFAALEASLRAREEPPRKPPEVLDCARFLNAFVEVWDRGEHGYWTILLGERVAGFGGVQPKLWRDRRCWNLYYRVAPEFWGMGIATETARAAIAAGASAQPGWPVLVETSPSNASAIRVAERVGLTRQPACPDGEYAVLLLEPGA
ncbi:GNAT family N-acetyltransferase [Saccharopolyspora erythraea]|uniref:GNAT family N-acetyltransferase n=1 Tax=Saccharopolyspora erythraea TaxID=1836 RepID=UPI001BA53C8A|nr:GNAT family N-acetyltransferase [Saccharopolyspora erythraea]QUH02536.1 GNAT family N-acetyltransferase [Saccharopolyspora erythraea]